MAPQTKKSTTTMAFFIIIISFFSLLLTTSLSIEPSSLQTSLINSRAFEIDDDKFWKDGEQFQIIGGDVHYFRVHPVYWRDRLLRAKALGLNTIQTYVPWNIHEPRPGQWVFDGFADIESFLVVCKELDLLVMLRAGPYICGEWDFGGFPAWLLAVEPALELRSSDPAFLQLVEKWWSVLLPKVYPFLYNNGGPIIMVQIENEYGSYGEDKGYLRRLVTLARGHLGDSTILYTTDGGRRPNLEKGNIPGANVYSAVDFTTGDDPWPIFKLQQEFNAPGKSPPLSAEFYTGWLTHWGEKMAETDAAFTANALKTILCQNGSVVLYMAHGGTNFGFLNGANTGANESDYKADLTSYDYDAPIKEWGDVNNAKFRGGLHFNLMRVIKRCSTASVSPIPPNNKMKGYGPIKVQKIASLFDALDTISDSMDIIEAQSPVSMESAGQMFGFLLYVSDYPVKENGSVLSVPKVHDRAQVFVSCGDHGSSQKYVGTIERWLNKALRVPRIKCSSNIRLYILVENMGHLNHGAYIYDRKGILSAVIVDGSILHGWKMYPISFQNLNKLLTVNPIVQFPDSKSANKFSYKKIKRNSRTSSKVPGFYEGRFTIDTINQVKDTFISFSGWGKGVTFVNNFNIGRFWPLVGPQCNLYVPAPVLRHGENVVIILELEAPNPELTISSVDYPDFTCGSKVHQL
ncbi:hypothetical protein GIB67_041592 [Kingdonia uniflora]|uniref:Beta-galactosidase n=1 Tax=Kingdonia uniflora TaxID=39325 RepID=A0A7J7MQG9_9MAGN|nr:hypothetical protein GIB67_041592 [Kingdonia uniflora]